MNTYLIASIAVMAGVTYLIRSLPLAAIRGKVKSRFFASFLYYAPYAVLSAMTVPAIFEATNSPVSAAVGFGAGFVLAYIKKPLLAVAVAACVAALVVEACMGLL